MAIDGYVIKLEPPELREMISLLRRSSNNLNQIARRVNFTDQIYAEDMDEILRWQKKFWQCANGFEGAGRYRLTVCFSKSAGTVRSRRCQSAKKGLGAGATIKPKREISASVYTDAQLAK